jgi:hypothetical protein
MRHAGRAVWLAALAAAWLIIAWSSAQACACCTNPGQRMVAREPLTAARLSELQGLDFAPSAQLYLGEADTDSIRGIATPSEHYDLTVALTRNGLTFAMRDKAGRAGTLVLAWPGSIAIFEVDPREARPDHGLGPTLYKEWKLTAKASGTGVFAPGAGPQQHITLILHGRGNRCTDASHFTAWTLLVHGPTAEYMLLGALK